LATVRTTISKKLKCNSLSDANYLSNKQGFKNLTQKDG